ncbi:MAG: UDP-N-acetylglucosamine--N-acetylmuramyl-(pentapeptide) pyrophosphoryl-undecaprenol N-acetylglucosamine transferase, partial [Helicobacter sp.]|nr:UDP-N-acetylglucosamine--N-acetylmuramyl-(pentapeptide) pyrophosphoryl-undecaprenol N-acetylglucosamine transferase [Helicobacter sp.]
SFGAIFLKIPLIIHEQNARIGRLNKLLRPYAKLFFSSYLKSSPNKFYPVRRAFFQKARIRKTIKNILFMGGSQGAKTINNFALSVAEGLKERGIIIYHQCGEIDFKRECDQYQSMDLKVKCFRIFDDFLQDDLKEKFDVFLFAFIHEIPEIFYRCDFAVSRSGASSLWELCANGLPALFVPYPYAASNHQFFNAKFLEDQNLGFLCEEKDLYDEVLWNVLDLCQQRVEQMSENLQKYCQLDATAQILEIILKEC